ncbi:NAD(P)-dependent oxidoreductase [Patescibacteria group bacterium]|nr:NAD(P)-dependent oxidoreductase [Patescibacteria group bacterium]
MAVLITGGYGLLGSWVAYYLAKEGKKIIMFDVTFQRLDYLEEVEDLLIPIKGSVLDWPKLVQTFKKFEGEIEGIIHTPATTATAVYWKNPYQGTILNIMGSLNILEMARLYGVKKVIYISSGAVYGEVKGGICETTYPVKPSDLYGASKASAEFLGLQYQNHYGIDFRIVRPYFFFGPGRLPSQLPPLFKTLFGCIEGLSNLELEKGADQSLGFTYVKDTAWGTVLVYKAENLKYQTFNIAADKAINFLDLVDIAKKYSSTPTKVKIGSGKLFPRGETLDTSLARKCLGFEPKYDIEEAVAEYAKWISKNIKRI